MPSPTLDRWIFAGFPASARGLGLFRIVFALYVLLVLSPSADLLLVGRLPAGLFAPPPGPMRLVSAPPPAFLAVLSVALDVALVALLLGARTRAASVAVSVLLLVGYGFAFSFGKVIHNILFVLAPLCLAASGWGAAYSVDRLRGRVRGAVKAWPLAVLALLIGFAMFTAGFPKLLGGWLDPSTQATRGHFVNQYFSHDRQDFLGPLFLSLRSDAAWEVLDVATVVLELGFLAAVFVPRVFRVFLGLAVGFHLGTLLMLNISFAFNLIVYAAFLPWGRIERAVRPYLVRLPRPAMRARSVAVLVLAGGVLLHLVGSPLALFDDLVPFSSGLVLRDVLAALGAASVVGACMLLALRRRGPVGRPAFWRRLDSP